jgi:hypothetical protein
MDCGRYGSCVPVSTAQAGALLLSAVTKLPEFPFPSHPIQRCRSDLTSKSLASVVKHAAVRDSTPALGTRATPGSSPPPAMSRTSNSTPLLCCIMLSWMCSPALAGAESPSSAAGLPAGLDLRHRAMTSSPKAVAAPPTQRSQLCQPHPPRSGSSTRKMFGPVSTYRGKSRRINSRSRNLGESSRCVAFFAFWC